MLKQEKKIKETYTDYEIEKLLKKPVIKSCTFNEYRNWVIVNYLLATGNRLSSMTNIKIGDIDFDNNFISVTKTKNRKQQIIPISTFLAGILKEYLSYRKGEADEYLFCSMYGTQLTKDAIQQSISRYNTNRGVTKTSIHLFRHTFAKKWILNGGDIFRLQKILGHSSLDVVKEYVNMFNADLKEKFDVFNPLDSFMKEKNIKKDKIEMKKICL